LWWSHGDKGLPFLPNFNAAQELYVQYKVTLLEVGMESLSHPIQQFYDPINNIEFFYTFQGLTSDGKYWISAILPISNHCCLRWQKPTQWAE